MRRELLQIVQILMRTIQLQLASLGGINNTQRMSIVQCKAWIQFHDLTNSRIEKYIECSNSDITIKVNASHVGIPSIHSKQISQGINRHKLVSASISAILEPFSVPRRLLLSASGDQTGLSLLMKSGKVTDAVFISRIAVEPANTCALVVLG